MAAALYGFLFLRLPIAEGMQIDGVAISRAGFILGSLLYPEGLAESWFDSGWLAAGFLDRLPIAAGTLLWLALAALVGQPLVDRVLDRSRARGSQVERWTLATLTGLALLSTLTLAVGLAGGLHSRVPLVIAVCSLVVLVHGASWLKRRRRPLAGESEAATAGLLSLEESHARGLFDRACMSVAIGLACWSAVVTMLGAWVPASEFDVLEYHLQAPKEFYELGSVRFLPHNIYANMPLGTEMHTLAMMTLIGQSDTWWGGLIGKSISASLSLVGAALLGGFLARRFGGLCGWWAAGLWLATPGIAHVATLGLIDGALATYVLAAAVCVMRAIEALGSEQGSGATNDASISCARTIAPGWWGLAGIMAGAAAAAKYPGLIFAGVPVAATFVVVVGGRRLLGGRPAGAWATPVPRREPLLAAGWLALGLIATCMPWYAKNWIQAGNPVYPLAANVFGGQTLTEAKIEQWQRAHRVPNAAPPEAGAAEQLVAGTRRAASDLERLVLTSPYVQPAMVFGVCLGACAWLDRRKRVDGNLTLWLGWSLWIIAVWWLATHRIDRFWLPVTGLWAAVAAIGLSWLRAGRMPWLAHVVAIVGLVYGGLFNSTSLISDNRYFVALAALRNDVTTDERVGRVPAAQAWINSNLPASGSRVLLIGEAAVFEYRVPVLYSTCFDINPGEVMLKGKTPAAQAAALRASGVTHIMIHWGEIARYRSPGNYGFSDWPQPADIERWIASGIVSRVQWPFRDGSVELLKVE